MGGVPCSSSEQHGPPHCMQCPPPPHHPSYYVCPHCLLHFVHTFHTHPNRPPPPVTISTLHHPIHNILALHHNVATATIAPLFCSRRVPRRYWLLSRLRTPTTSSPHLLCRSLRSRVRVRLSQAPRPPPIRPRPPRRTSLCAQRTRSPQRPAIALRVSPPIGPSDGQVRPNTSTKISLLRTLS